MKDFRRMASGDIDLSTGDLQLQDATREHQRDLLLAHRGDYRLDPLVGIGMLDFIDDESPDALYREIRTQFVRDGMTVIQVSLTNTVAHYD